MDLEMVKMRDFSNPCHSIVIGVAIFDFSRSRPCFLFHVTMHLACLGQYALSLIFCAHVHCHVYTMAIFEVRLLHVLALHQVSIVLAVERRLQLLEV